MKQIKWPLLFFAFAAAACMIWTGIAIGYRNVPSTILSLVALVIVMGFAFKTKKKMQDNGEL